MKILFLSGSALLIFTTLILIIVIPIYNSKIEGVSKAISKLSNTIKEKEFQYRDFQNAELMIVNMRNMLMLLESSNLRQSKAYGKINTEFYSTRVNSLLILAGAADIVNSHIEMNQLTSKLKAKSFDELERIKAEYSLSLSKKLNELVSKQNSLEKEYGEMKKTRNNINLVGGVVQGIALFLLAWGGYLNNFQK